eukprot:TRINITY_DN10935_c0_g1_i2.p1 TRINITY_DN10935_c0_g1~~TRINITY_DN10935_c0_g1_i2.p1  ORF type:complete len:438 (+),score=57.69 TRINITY_DN10935_c0_g1_i2:37-1350(+)
MSSSDRRCSQCFCCAAGDDDIATENLARAELPDAWSQMLGDGHVLSSLLLATVYSEKYRGRNMHPDETAQLALPIGPEEGNNRESSATLLHRTYSKENAAFIWRCNELDAKVVYIAFNPLRKNVQFVRLLKNVALGAVLVNHEMPLPVPDTGGLTVRRSRPVKMMRYISQKVESLYVKHEFSRMLDDTLSRFPDHRMIFTGISHGATLAQAAALRASMRYPDRQFHIATWNAYKWTDAEGSRLMDEVFGKRLLPFVISQEGQDGARRRWDSVSGAPSGLASMRGITFLDAETGEFRVCPRVPDLTIGVTAARAAMDLHFARTALRATKLAMIVAFGESQRFRSASQGSAAFGAEDVVAPLGSEIQSSLYSEDRQSGLPPRAARQTCPAYLSGQQRVADDFDDMVHSCYGAPRRSSSGLSKSRSDSAPTHPLRRSETG